MSLVFISIWLACTGAKLAADPDADTGAEALVDPLSWSVRAPGPYGVGYRSFEARYSPGPAFEERFIRVNLWYPTDDTDGPEGEYTVGIDALVIEEASFAAPVHGGGYPVHVHSHGHMGYGATSAFLARYFASHGIVTVAPDHTDNTIIDNQDPLGAAHYFHRPLDIKAALNALDAQEAPFDTAAVMLSGHSFGAYTTWGSAGAEYQNAGPACSDWCTPQEEEMFGPGLKDERVVSTMPMAGTLRRQWFGDSGEMSVGGPVLFFSGTNDDVGQLNQFEQLGNIDFTWMELEGGCHQSFALGACSSLDPQLGFELIQTTALAFFRQTVLGDFADETVGIATGETRLSDIVITRRRQGG